MSEKPAEPLVFVGCSQLVTMRGPARARVGPELRELGIVADGAMIVEDGRVSAVGSRSAVVDSLPSACRVVDLGGCVVAPGFVDAHTHPVFGGDRLDDFERRCSGASYEEIAAAGGGIRSTVAKTQATSSENLLAGAKRHAGLFLRSGTTTIEAKSGYGGSVEEELRLLRTIRSLSDESPLRVVPTVLGAHAILKNQTAEVVAHDVANRLIPEVSRDRLAEYCDAFMEKGYFGENDVRTIMAAAKEYGLKVRLHADQLTLSGGAKIAAELGAATADHLECVDSAGIAAMKAAGVQPVLLPGSVYFLGSRRYAPAREMIDAGLAVVLATDFNPGSSPTPAMPMAMSLACTQMRMTPAEALTAATVNAAWSVGRGDVLGSLEQGKWADFTVFDCSDWREIAYWYGVDLARRVYIGGDQVYERA